MKTSYKKLNRIKDILEITGDTIVGNYDNFDDSVSRISLFNKDLDGQIHRFLKQKKNYIIDDLKINKLVKVRSCIGIYTLLFT